jgi:hypothetical protein
MRLRPGPVAPMLDIEAQGGDRVFPVERQRHLRLGPCLGPGPGPGPGPGLAGPPDARRPQPHLGVAPQLAPAQRLRHRPHDPVAVQNQRAAALHRGAPAWPARSEAAHRLMSSAGFSEIAWLTGNRGPRATTPTGSANSNATTPRWRGGRLGARAQGGATTRFDGAATARRIAPRAVFNSRPGQAKRKLSRTHCRSVEAMPSRWTLPRSELWP